MDGLTAVIVAVVFMASLIGFGRVMAGDVPVPRRLRSAVAGGAIAVGATALVYGWSVTPSFVNPRWKAASFRWPEDCPTQKYRRGNAVSRSCIQKRFEVDLDQAIANGILPSRGSDGKLYRLGNDVVSYSCLPFGGNCTVATAYQDVFVEEKRQ